MSTEYDVVKQDFRVRVWTWAEQIKVQPNRIEVRRMSRKWASCSSRRCVCFAEMLLVESIEFQDYVIVHELLHLRVPNHGKLFKSLMSVYVPGWERLTLGAARGVIRQDRQLLISAELL